MTAMNNKVFGILGIASHMSNFNADFTGNPRKYNETYFASNVSGKYPIRAYWDKLGEKVFYLKSMKVEKEKIVPRLMEERYEQQFGQKIKANTTKEITEKLFTCLDVLNFGGTFANKSNNISITGAVQLTEGINKYDKTATIREDILSPFVNSNKEDASQTTLGSRTFTTEAHYFFGLSINPLNYKEFVENLDGFEGYTAEAYELLKDGCLYGVNELQSMSKAGCENEFALFVELKEGSKVSMANLHNYVSFEKEDGEKGKIDLTNLANYLKPFESHIEKVEIYMNPITTTILFGDLEMENLQVFSIFDKSVIQ